MGLRPPRRYWLTGAGNGVGASLAEALLRTGAHLAISSRTAQPCEALSARYPGQVLALPGNLTDSQTVREIGEQITQHWGSLDTVILNAGTAEYSDSHIVDHTLIEHIVRSNLLAASLCIEAALPLLRTGTTSHLVGIASPATYLSPSRTEADSGGMRDLFESARVDLASENIDVTLLHPGFDSLSLSPDDCWQAPAPLSADEAAVHILSCLSQRPHKVAFPVASMTALWPLPSSTEPLQADNDSYQAIKGCPIKGQP